MEGGWGAMVMAGGNKRDVDGIDQRYVCVCAWSVHGVCMEGGWGLQ